MRLLGSVLVLALLVAVTAGAEGAAGAPGPEASSTTRGDGGERPLASYNWSKRVAKANRWARQRAGRVSFSVRAQGVKRSRDGGRVFESASVVKVMLLVAYVRRERDSSLDDGERELLRIMIRRSHNGAATEIRDRLGNSALEDLGRKVGMRCFATAPSWGSTRTCSRDQAKLMLGIRELLPDRHRGFAMTQLRKIVPRQRWGIPEATRWEPYFKGGWIEDPDGWRTHQVALLRGPSREELAVAILSSGQPSRNYGRATVRGVAERLVGPVTR